MSAKEQVKKEIIEAYVFLRTNNMTIPSETLEFMKDSSLKALDQALTIPVVSVRKIVRCEDPMICLRGCSVHKQTCKHPIYER